MSAAEQLEPCLRCRGGWRSGVECRRCLGSGHRDMAPERRARPIHQAALEQVTDRLTRELASRRRTDAQHEASAIARALQIEAPEAVLPLLRARGYQGEDARELAVAVVAAVEERVSILGLWTRTRESSERKALAAWAWKAREALRRAE